MFKKLIGRAYRTVMGNRDQKKFWSDVCKVLGTAAVIGGTTLLNPVSDGKAPKTVLVVIHNTTFGPAWLGVLLVALGVIILAVGAIALRRNKGV